MVVLLIFGFIQAPNNSKRLAKENHSVHSGGSRGRNFCFLSRICGLPAVRVDFQVCDTV